MKQVSYFAVAALVMALAGPAVAFGPGGKHGPQIDFETLDADGNGEVTKAELQSHGQARFAQADSDGDGKLTAAELTAAARKQSEDRVAHMIERFDTDGDGALSQDEMPKPRKRRGDRMFDVMDADDSGGISRAEFDEARAWMEERRGKRKGKHRDHGKPQQD